MQTNTTSRWMQARRMPSSHIPEMARLALLFALAVKEQTTKLSGFIKRNGTTIP